MNDRDLTKYQADYNQQPYEKYQAKYRKKKLIEILGRHNHRNLLEVGCGEESIFLSLDTYEQITVIEPAGHFYAKAVADVKQAKNQNIKLLEKLFEDVAKSSFNSDLDFIIVSSLLHEITDQGKFLDHLHSIASDKTVIHINVPNAKSFHRLVAVEMGLIKTEFELSSNNKQFQQNCNFDLASLSALAEQHGFKIIESGTSLFKPFTHKQMQAMIDSGIINDDVLDGLYKMDKYIPDFCSEIFINITRK